MCNKFETLHANYLDPPEPKVWDTIGKVKKYT